MYRLTLQQFFKIAFLVWSVGGLASCEARLCSKHGCLNDYCCLMKLTYGKAAGKNIAFLPFAYVAKCGGRELTCRFGKTTPASTARAATATRSTHITYKTPVTAITTTTTNSTNFSTNATSTTTTTTKRP